MVEKKRGLGRGLSALMADVNRSDEPTAKPDGGRRAEQFVPVEKIAPNPDQPRRSFDPEKLEDLANSIREKGVIQPLIVRADPRQGDKGGDAARAALSLFRLSQRGND